jgi:hypothetical protein
VAGAAAALFSAKSGYIFLHPAKLKHQKHLLVCLYHENMLKSVKPDALSSLNSLSQFSLAEYIN